MDVKDQLLFLIIIYWYLKRTSSRRLQRINDSTSALSGHVYTQELLGGSNRRCQELMHVSRDAYVQLCNKFKEKNWLQNSSYVSVEEKMAMFLTVLGHNERFGMVKRRFQHSRKTIDKCFYEVLNGMMKFAREVVVPTSFDATPNTSERYKTLRQIFPGAIGALDGILVHAVAPVDQQTRYKRRRTGECYQNVLAMCDFNMIFTFVWAGWEGLAHDSRVLREVSFDPTSRFPFPPPNKYYLCDAAYINTRGFMTPYRNTRYKLADFQRRRALTKKERFNYAHAQLRDVIERAYDVLKTRFPILKQMASYPFPVQRDIAIACFAIHNFIRKCDIHDELFAKCDENTTFTEEPPQDEGSEEVDQEEGSGEDEDDGTQWSAQDMQFMARLRDQIANQLLTNASN